MKVVRDAYLKWRKIYQSRMQVKTNITNSVKILDKFRLYHKQKLTIQSFYGLQKHKEKQDQKSLVLAKLVSRINLAKNRVFYKLLNFSREQVFKLELLDRVYRTLKRRNTFNSFHKIRSYGNLKFQKDHLLKLQALGKLRSNVHNDHIRIARKKESMLRLK
jgi:hypothetical protein